MFLKINMVQWIFYLIEPFCSDLGINLSGFAVFMSHQALPRRINFIQRIEPLGFTLHSVVYLIQRG